MDAGGRPGGLEWEGDPEAELHRLALPRAQLGVAEDEGGGGDGGVGAEAGEAGHGPGRGLGESDEGVPGGGALEGGEARGAADDAGGGDGQAQVLLRAHRPAVGGGGLAGDDGGHFTMLSAVGCVPIRPVPPVKLAQELAYANDGAWASERLPFGILAQSLFFAPQPGEKGTADSVRLVFPCYTSLVMRFQQE